MDKTLIRKIFTPFKHDATVRPIAAKLLSGKHIDKPRSTFSWGCESQDARYLVPKPTLLIKQPLNYERMTI